MGQVALTFTQKVRIDSSNIQFKTVRVRGEHVNYVLQEILHGKWMNCIGFLK